MSQLISKYDYPEFLQPIGLSSPAVDNLALDNLMFGAGPAQQNINVAQVTETNLVQAIAKSKSKTVPQIIETDSVQSITAQRKKSVVQVSETETAQAVSKQKRINVVQVIETDLSNAVGKIKSKSVSQVIESDLSNSIDKKKSKIVRQATSNIIPAPSSYFDVSSGIIDWEVTIATRVWNQGGWMDLSFPSSSYLMVFNVTFIPAQKEYTSYLLSLKVKSDGYTGQLRIWVGSNSYLLPTNVSSEWQEIELAFTYTTGNNVLRIESNSQVNGGVILSYDDILLSPIEVAQVIGKRKSKAINQTVETDESNLISSQKKRMIANVSEIDEALIITTELKIETALESDIAFSIKPVKRINIVQVIETNSANSLSKTKQLVINPVNEIDIVNEASITPLKKRTIEQVSETSESQSLEKILKKFNITTAEEVDSSQPINRFVQNFIPVATVYEVNNAGKIICRNFDINQVDAKDVSSKFFDDGILTVIKDNGLVSDLMDKNNWTADIKENDLTAEVMYNLESRIIE